MPRESSIHLSRRERQIMDIIYRLGHASAAEVQKNLADPPSYSAVRALLRVLEEKGHLRHKKNGARYVFLPTQPRQNAARSALRRLLRTFFDNSAERAVVALLDVSDLKLSPTDLEHLTQLIDKARKEGR
jgi:predicted transcriptional regulator